MHNEKLKFCDIPLVSVIVPVFNAEKHIQKCVDSLLKQTYQNTEIILIDDGSADQSGTICDEYAACHATVKVIHKKNGGVSSARNAGMRAASGEYLHFCDADDWLEPETYQEIIPQLISEKAETAVFGWYVDTEEKEGVRSVSKADHALDGVGSQFDIFQTMLMLSGNYGGLKGYGNFIWNRIYKKESLLDRNSRLILFDEETEVAEDGLWLVRAAQNWYKGVFFRKPYYHYVQNKESTMNTAENFCSTRLASQKSHMKMLEILRDYNLEYYEIHRQACMEYFWITAKSEPMKREKEFIAQVIANVLKINNGVCPEHIANDVLAALRTAARYRGLKKRKPVKIAVKITQIMDKIKKNILNLCS